MILGEVEIGAFVMTPRFYNIDDFIPLFSTPSSFSLQVPFLSLAGFFSFILPSPVPSFEQTHPP